MANKKARTNTRVKVSEQDFPRHGYGEIPQELRPFMVYQYQIGGLILYCEKCEMVGENKDSFSFDNVVFYEIRSDIYAFNSSIKLKMWSFYDRVFVKFVDGTPVFAFKPCIFQDVVTDMILSEEELNARIAAREAERAAAEESIEEIEPEPAPRKDPFGREKTKKDEGEESEDPI